MKPIFNRAPLPPNPMAPLSLGSIRPEGWLKEQLRVQADGLSGKLHEIWDDVNEKCAWLGGEGDGWERAPYYLDGLIPLAWALDDECLKAVCMKYVEWILSSGREDGWFGPAKNDDYWPLMVALKALRQYFTATADKRVLTLMDRYFRYQYKNLATKPMREWAVARGGDNMELALWLYNLTGQKYLLELCKRLKEQTLDWPNFFHTFPYASALSKSIPWERMVQGKADEEAENERLEGTNRPYFHSQFHYTHGVNVAMGLKTPGVISMFKSGFKEQDGFRFGYDKLMKHHGLAYGMFSCDEHINGKNPTQGTELCAVVELMYTLETLLGIGSFGDDLPDILERLAFNALPAMFDKDMNLHQYDMQANQIKVSDAPRRWYNNGNDSNIFGFAPNFGCCTANYHQGWPKFVASLWYASNDGGLSAVSYAPCTVKTVLNGVPVGLTVGGEYPFSEEVTITVSVKHPTEFPLHLRIPAWSRRPMITLPNGELMIVRAGSDACLNRKWQNGDVIRIDLPTAPKVTRWFNQSGAVELGPLLMAFQPEEHWHKLDNGDYAIDTDTPWNYALVRDEPMKAVYEPDCAGAFGHGNPAVSVMAKVIQTDWHEEANSAANIPISPKAAGKPTKIIELVPFGDTCLRISQFPLTAPVADNTERVMV